MSSDSHAVPLAAAPRDPALLAEITAHTGIQFNAHNEPFLPIPHPTLNLALTPYRPSDVPAQVRSLNDPAVALWLSGPPFPHRAEHSLAWQAVVNARWEAQMAKSEAGDWTPPEESVFSAIRNVETGEMVGDIGYVRWGWEELAGNGEAKAAAVARERGIVAGDPEATWSVGFWLNPDWHGKGIMGATLHSLVYNFMIPTLHCERIKSCAFVGNEGSRNVHEKFGFEYRGTFYATPNAAVRGREKEQWLFEWRKPKSPAE